MDHDAAHEVGFPAHLNRDADVRMRRTIYQRLSRRTSSLRARLASSESSQSCPKQAHRVYGRVPFMHLLAWDCIAVRCEISLLRPESDCFRVEEGIDYSNKDSEEANPQVGNSGFLEPWMDGSLASSVLSLATDATASSPRPSRSRTTRSSSAIRTGSTAHR